MAVFSSQKSKIDSTGPLKRLFTREPHNFKYYPAPNIIVSSPDCGPSGQIGNLNFVAGENSPAALFPTLTWNFKPAETLEDALTSEKKQQTREYLMLVEDIDSARFTWVNVAPTAALLGVFYGIARDKTGICAADMVKVKKAKLKWISTAQRRLVGGFKHGEVPGGVWTKPKTLHRIHFQIIALSHSIDIAELSEHPTRESFNGAVEGKVLGWGEWVGVYDKQRDEDAGGPKVNVAHPAGMTEAD